MSSIHLLSSGRICGFATSNRIAQMTRTRAEPWGVSSDLAIEYDSQRASPDPDLPIRVGLYAELASTFFPAGAKGYTDLATLPRA